MKLVIYKTSIKELRPGKPGLICNPKREKDFIKFNHLIFDSIVLN